MSWLTALTECGFLKSVVPVPANERTRLVADRRCMRQPWLLPSRTENDGCAIRRRASLLNRKKHALSLVRNGIENSSLMAPKAHSGQRGQFANTLSSLPFSA